MKNGAKKWRDKELLSFLQRDSSEEETHNEALERIYYHYSYMTSTRRKKEQLRETQK
jgi:hypothetical protein